ERRSSGESQGGFERSLARVRASPLSLVVRRREVRYRASEFRDLPSDATGGSYLRSVDRKRLEIGDRRVEFRRPAALAWWSEAGSLPPGSSRKPVSVGPAWSASCTGGHTLRIAAYLRFAIAYGLSST